MKTTILIIGFILTYNGVLFGQQKAAIYQTKNGAIDGYDAVAYFNQQKPVKGSNDFTFIWKDATWKFSNKSNLKTFKANPEKYIPQYGGYCAYGYAKGTNSPIDPASFSILNNKLYLNYNSKVQEMWGKDRVGLIEDADKRFEKENKKVK